MRLAELRKWIQLLLRLFFLPLPSNEGDRYLSVSLSLSYGTVFPFVTSILYTSEGTQHLTLVRALLERSQKGEKTRSNSPTSNLKCADICDGVLLIVLSLVALVALSSLPLYEVGAPLGYKLISKTFLPGLFTGWALELLRCHSADCSFNGKQAIFLTLTIAILLGSLYWLWVEVSY